MAILVEMCNMDTVGALLERALHGTATWWGSDSDSLGDSCGWCNECTMCDDCTVDVSLD